MEKVTVTIDENGTIRGLMDTATGEFLDFLAVDDTLHVMRASHVEPSNPVFRFFFHLLRFLFTEYGMMATFTRKWPCLWRVNLSPIDGPILSEQYHDRQKAIAAEVKWLHENFL